MGGAFKGILLVKEIRGNLMVKEVKATLMGNTKVKI